MRFLNALLLSATATLFSVNAVAADLHDSWDKLLKKHVVSISGGKSTAINYSAVKQDSAQLNNYIESLQKVSASEYNGWSRDAKLAFLINAYNAYTVQLIVENYPGLESIKDLGSVFSSTWSKDRGPLLGKMRTLDDIEHKMIRGQNGFKEPRIHFAVNCASIGCPSLRAEAYTASKLEKQLAEQTRLFLSDTTRNRLDGNTLHVSKIFDWYKEDFQAGWKGTTSLAKFLARYDSALSLSASNVTALNSGNMSIKFLDYNWKLNDQK